MPLDIYRPFTTAEAVSAGITHQRLRRKEFRRLLGGVHISSRVPYTASLRTRAALLVHPDGAVATHASAARLLGVPVPHDPLEHVTVARKEDRRQRHGVRCHVAALRDHDVRVLDGLRMSSPHRMFVELASKLPLVDLVVVGDWLVRKKHVTCESLVEYCAGAGDRHADAARRAAAYVRDRVDSVMETRLRMLLVLAGLPEPQVNPRLRDEHGTVIMRLDLAYPEVRLAVEYDGRQHAEVVEQWERDLDRREDLDEDGWRLIVVTSKGIYREPERTLQRVRKALEERGHRPLPPIGDGWRAHFGR
jgi:very-short-patch-repair endonuclease